MFDRVLNTPWTLEYVLRKLSKLYSKKENIFCTIRNIIDLKHQEGHSKNFPDGRRPKVNRFENHQILPLHTNG